MEDEQDLALWNDRCNLLLWETTVFSWTESGLEYAFFLFFTSKVTPEHFIYYFFSVICYKYSAKDTQFFVVTR